MKTKKQLVPRPRKKEPRIYCKYDGAKLKRDIVGKKCPTKNCHWEHGMSKEDEFL